MAQTAQLRRIDVAENEAQRVFNLQREAYLRQPYPSYEERRANLDKLERILVDNAAAIAEAINADFGHRAYEETMMAELFTSVDGIRDVRRKLRKWMKPQRRHVSMLFATGSNRVIPQPKGVVGVVSPWNYPLFLTWSPLTSILAAGNRAMRCHRDLVALRRARDGATRGLRGSQVAILRADNAGKLLAYHRWSDGGPHDDTVVVANFADSPLDDVRIGFPAPGRWTVRLNSDATSYDLAFAGHDVFDLDADGDPMDGCAQSGLVSVGPYAVVIYARES